MKQMFYKVTAFDQNIGNWNTAAVTDMPDMFKGATSFNQDIGNWDTSAVVYMFGMFNQASAFNQYLLLGITDPCGSRVASPRIERMRLKNLEFSMCSISSAISCTSSNSKCISLTK